MRRIVPILLALVAVLLISLPASADTSAVNLEIQDLRARQAELAQNRDFLRDRASDYNDQRAQGRVWAVPYTLFRFEGSTIMTAAEALDAFTAEYFLHLFETGSDFSSADLAAYIKARRDHSRNIETALEDSAQLFRQRADDFDAEWKRIEARIAELMEAANVPGQKAEGGRLVVPDASCITLDSVERNDGGDGSGVTSFTSQGNVAGYEIDITMTWTPPPARLCNGDTFQITMTVTNSGDVDAKIPRNYLAKIALSDFGPGIARDTCSNPSTWSDPTGYEEARLKPETGSYSNTCTFKVGDVVLAYDEPQTALRIGVSSENGVDAFLYRYSH